MSTTTATSTTTARALAALWERYALEMDPESIPGLVKRFGLRFPGEPV